MGSCRHCYESVHATCVTGCAIGHTIDMDHTGRVLASSSRSGLAYELWRKDLNRVSRECSARGRDVVFVANHLYPTVHTQDVAVELCRNRNKNATTRIRHLIQILVLRWLRRFGRICHDSLPRGIGVVLGLLNL